MTEPTKDSVAATGAVRSADRDHMDFSSLPLLGLLGVIRVAGVGGVKYGRHNYNQGLPVHETLNHAAVHLILYLLGDRREDHLSKVAWNAMVANQTAILNPELAEPYLLGPGATLTPALLAELERGKAERDAKRQAGLLESLCHWVLGDVPEVQRVLAARTNATVVSSAVESTFGPNWTDFETRYRAAQSQRERRVELAALLRQLANESRNGAGRVVSTAETSSRAVELDVAAALLETATSFDS